jgi:hypothetical protein
MTVLGYRNNEVTLTVLERLSKAFSVFNRAVFSLAWDQPDFGTHNICWSLPLTCFPASHQTHQQIERGLLRGIKHSQCISLWILISSVTVSLDGFLIPCTSSWGRMPLSRFCASFLHLYMFWEVAVPALRQPYEAGRLNIHLSILCWCIPSGNKTKTFRTFATGSNKPRRIAEAMEDMRTSLLTNDLTFSTCLQTTTMPLGPRKALSVNSWTCTCNVFGIEKWLGKS